MSSPENCYQASWLWSKEKGPVARGWVSLDRGKVAGAGQGKAPGQCRDLGDGLIMPGLVNAHCHLELSGLAGLAQPAGDFVGWLNQLVKVRRSQDKEKSAQATKQAAQSAHQSGTVLLGDISNTGLARQAAHQAGLSCLTFFEAMGYDECQPPQPEWSWRESRLAATSAAAHSVYSVPGGRIASLKQLAGDLPFAIHLAESAAEMEFLAGQGREGQRLADFMERRAAIQRDRLELLHPHPLRNLAELGVLDQSTLLVHGAQLDPHDGELIASKGASLCVCPRSNLGLTGSLAPVRRLSRAGVNLCLGSDSLMSTPSLNLWEEMAALQQARPAFPAEQILAMATANGAAALGLGDAYGRVEPGFRAPLLFVPLPPGLAPGQAMQAAIDGNWAGPLRLLG